MQGRGGSGRFRRYDFNRFGVDSDSHACRTTTRDGEDNVPSRSRPAVGANEDAAFAALLDTGRADRTVASKYALDGETCSAFPIHRS
jgi:hypothetical protein